LKDEIEKNNKKEQKMTQVNITNLQNS